MEKSALNPYFNHELQGFPAEFPTISGNTGFVSAQHDYPSMTVAYELFQPRHPHPIRFTEPTNGEPFALSEWSS